MEVANFAERESKLCIDLCTGRGGFSKSFKNAGWWVVGIDVEKKHRPTIVADVRYLPLRENLEPDVLVMSPPCQRFSIACPQWPKKGIKLALEIVGASATPNNPNLFSPNSFEVACWGNSGKSPPESITPFSTLPPTASEQSLNPAGCVVSRGGNVRVLTV
jgi:hypothetical protein